MESSAPALTPAKSRGRPTTSRSSGYCLMYYPGVEQKIAAIFSQNLELWKAAIEKAKESGEIRQDVDVDEAASMFWQMFFGTSYELSFFQGLDTRKLSRSLHFLYSLLKA